MASSLKALVEKAPQLAFVTGHGERNPYHMGERGFGLFLTNPNNRQSLVNKGFVVDTVSLNVPVSDAVDILVLAEMKEPMTEMELQNLAAYLQRGGNFVVIADAGQQANLNPVVELLGLRFTEDVAGTTSRLGGDCVGANFTADIAKKVPAWANFVAGGVEIALPTPVGIKTIGEFNDFVVDDVLVSPNAQNSCDVFAKYMTRQINGKEQRIFVLGDSECLTLEVILKNRANAVLPAALFEHLAYNRFPVYVRPALPIDNKIVLEQSGVEWAKRICLWFPLVLILLFLTGVVINRRNR